MARTAHKDKPQPQLANPSLERGAVPFAMVYDAGRDTLPGISVFVRACRLDGPTLQHHGDQKKISRARFVDSRSCEVAHGHLGSR